MLSRARYGIIPEATLGGFERYVRYGISPGSFGRAVLENNLREAFACADAHNTEVMRHIVSYCYNEIPSACWGSPEKVAAWMQMKADGRAGAPDEESRPETAQP